MIIGSSGFPGERMFVDFAGRTAEVIDANTGER